MKYFLEAQPGNLWRWRRRWQRLAVLIVAGFGTVSALGELPAWIRNVESASALEAVFFRMMPLPARSVAFRRPAAETRPALGELITAQPANAELYSLRALEDEQQLDFSAAESDWKGYVGNSADKIGAQQALAEFYRRRLRPKDEIAALSLIANAAPLPAEKLTPPSEQRSWQAFERIFSIIQEQSIPRETSIAQYRAWINRYPDESSLYARFLSFLVAERQYAAAGQLISSYHRQFPADEIFPLKAKAMVEYRQGSVEDGLAVYEKNFQPLWNAELIKSYFDLLRETQSLRKFLDQARASLNSNPQDLNAMARIFYYHQQQGKLDAARAVIDDFRGHKESSKTRWSSGELYVCARLLEEIHAYPEAGRYYFALYASKASGDAEEQALQGLTSLLLSAPETPIRFGSGELSTYRDIATMDQGPGYLNGALSLLLNTTQPAVRYSEEELRAIPYFHRSRAAELLALLDQKFPNSTARPELHFQLLSFYAGVGEGDALIRGGQEFLAAFPKATQRTSVALLMADAYARKNDPTNEFAIYDSVLQELAAGAQNLPLGAQAAGADYEYFHGSQPEYEQSPPESGAESENRRASEAFRINAGGARARPAVRSPEYARVLERYLARLVEGKQIPQALGVLRREIDRNPDDPGLYERLAVFLEQNRLGAEQEEVYRRAITHFADPSWYDRLARFYLRYRRQSEFEELSREAIKSFKGSDLERYFQNVVGSPALYLRLNQYANQRFPHDPVFVRNLLNAYRNPETYDLSAWEALIRQHWFEEPDLQNHFFEFLSSTGRLESEMRALHEMAPDAASWVKNPAAADFLAAANLWRSHFEESAPPLKSLAALYPLDREMTRTASSVYRSLAYFDSRALATAVEIEENLLQANPGDRQTLARIGDIYADRERFAEAQPYWERIPQVFPGQADGYLEAASIYWDYYRFDDALRLIGQGRRQLHDQSLYSYQAGAIYENKRDYAHAVEEYLKGALDSSGSSAELRLLALAARPQFRDLIDQKTSAAAPLTGASMGAINLRVKVLEAQKRNRDLESFLDAAARNTSSIEQVESIGMLAQQKSLENVRQHALERQIALTGDPITRIELRYSVIALYESRNDFPAAEKNVEALYHENPKSLGVVRATVDFFWRTKNYSRAIAVLLDAAKDAYPDLSRQFTYEAARKATDAKLYSQARDLLTQLLRDDAYNSQYLAAMADALARAGDDRGLKQFYTDKIASLRNSELSAESRRTQISSLRRGLIPALTRLRDYQAAVDQYIELINSFPEDEALTSEAALYSERYQRQEQLVGFYQNTVTQSPRDYRWALVLARLQANLENYAASINAYAQAIAMRPDRADLFISRAGLEERVMRFEDAIADYERIYQLTYRDPQWMEKIAETRARQGRTNETVVALKTALIEGRPENAAGYFEVASRLERWEMLPEARSLAEQGVKLAGSELLSDTELLGGVKVYVRIMTRQRQYQQAYSTLAAALADSSSGATKTLAQQIAKQVTQGPSDERWTARGRELRMERARNGMAAALQQMGSTANAYFTPEERTAFAAFAESRRNGMDVPDLERFAIPLAENAALAEQEARWRLEALMARASDAASYGQIQAFIELERRRGRFAELGRELEPLAAMLPAAPAGRREHALLVAADAYRSAGQASNEMRILAALSGHTGNLDSLHQQRLFELLLASQPEELVRIASNWTVAGEQAAAYALAKGTPALSHAVVEARARTRPAVWRKSYDALVGLYFSETTPEVNRSFLSALGDLTVAERLLRPVDRSQQLAGSTWFYYGSRYGEYLGMTKQGHPEDYLAAELEQSPATTSNYANLADYYAGSGNLAQAIENYKYALELSPNRPDVYNKQAIVYYKQGDRAAAMASWKRAFTELSRELNGSRVPESFWTDFGAVCDELRRRQLFSPFKADVEATVRTYLRSSGNWRSNAVLKPVLLAAGDPQVATGWLIELASAAEDPIQILSDLAEVSWIPPLPREEVWQRILELKQDRLTKLSGLDRDSAGQDLAHWQVRWISYLVRAKQYARAADAIAGLTPEVRELEANALVPLDVEVAAKVGTLDRKLAAYRTVPKEAPPTNLLRAAARELLKSGDPQSARKVLEFAFAREIDEHRLEASNFLGLAEIRLAAGDTPGALELLRRLVAVVGKPFENLDPAASLLERTGHGAEAAEFLDQLVKSAPWDASYRLRQARAKLAAGQDSAAKDLASIASAAENPYDLRTQAARALVGRPHQALGSGELDVLAEDAHEVTLAAADRFYFYAARMRAAQQVADTENAVQLLSHCITDFPRRDDARVPLFLSAASVGSREFALAIIEPFVPGQLLGRAVEDQSTIDADHDQDEERELSAPSAGIAVKLPQEQKARLARMIGETLVDLGRLAESLPYFSAARRSVQSAGSRKTLDARISEVKAALRIERQNTARQPVLHAALEQDRPVQPKLVARVVRAITPERAKEP